MTQPRRYRTPRIECEECGDLFSLSDYSCPSCGTPAQTAEEAALEREIRENEMAREEAYR